MADPVAVREQKNPAVNLSAEEKRLFSQVFQAADKEKLGVVTGDIALAFFPQRTKLPVDVLGEIWQLADVDDKGFLTPNGFYIVLRLIGYAQAGKPVNAEAALRPGPLPKFDGINGMPSASQSSPAPLQPQGSGGAIRVPPLSPDKAGQYASLFEESGAQNGLLPGVTAKQIFDRAQLPNDILVRIWNLADTEMRGMLSCTEFIIAMHLLASFRSGAMRALPQSLPAGLYEAAARRGIPPRPSSNARAGPGSPSVSTLPRQVTGGPARATSPLASQQYVVPPIQPNGGQQTGPAADGWVVTASEKVKYDNQFAKLDPSGKGYVSGDEAVSFFGKSGLSEFDLAQIWDLADIRSEGRLSRDEFAVAMYLIVQKVQSRAPLPTTLPPNLVPPSMRNAIPDNQKSTAPDFQQPQVASAPKQAQSAAEDLFGLDALSGPITAPAAPQVPQSTGGSSSFATPSSPRTQGSPVPTSKAVGASTMFKPFQPSSSFGQGMVTPQQTGTSRDLQSRNVSAAQDDLLSDNDEGSRTIGSDSVEVGNLSNQVNTLTNQISDVKAKRGATEQTLSQAGSQKRELETRLAQLRQAYEQEAREVRVLDERLISVRKDNSKLQEDLVLVQHTQQNLTEQHEQISQQLTADQSENARLKELIGQVNGQVNELKPQIEKAKSDARQQKGLVAINKKQLATVETERDRLKSELDIAAKDHAEATRELADIQTKTSELSHESEGHSRELDTVREATRSLTEAHESHVREAPELTPSQPSVQVAGDVTSPAASVNSMNPFFKRSTTSPSVDPANVASPPAGSVVSPNHSAFDDFFGPSLGGGTTSTPPPPASFGSFPLPLVSKDTVQADGGELNEAAPSLSNEPRSKVPPSPPRSRQISPSVLYPRAEVTKATPDGPSSGAVAPTGHSDSASNTTALAETHGTGLGSSEIAQTDASDTARNDLEDSFSPIEQSKDLPGAFPDETPLQTPSHTGPEGSGSLLPITQIIGGDPFSSNTLTPASARDDFESAFSGFSETKGKAAEAPTTMNGTSGQLDTRSTEFPPIEHYENEDSDSDSDTGFEDSFASNHNARSALPPASHSAGLGQPPPADAQTSPPSYEKTSHEDDQIGGAQGTTTKFPAEYEGLLPSRQDPTATSQPLHSVPAADASGSPAAAAGNPSASNTAKSTLTQEKGDFDDFDDDFRDLTEAQPADDVAGAEDLTASIASRRETLDEFNPTFDSPAPSTRATNTTIVDPHSSFATGSFGELETSTQSGGAVTASSSAFGAVSQAPSSHDWDAMFAGLDSAGPLTQSNGTSALDEAFAGGPKTDRLAVDKPPLARAISEGTEHDDPILKNLTGMGFSREESLKALEKYDYNINKAADYLTSKS